jgi:hypothetical protein
VRKPERFARRETPGKSAEEEICLRLPGWNVLGELRLLSLGKRLSASTLWRF